MFAKLRGNTRKAKNRLREAGTDMWEIVDMSDTVQFSQEKGPWFLMRPPFEHGDRFIRWIRAKGDFHFKIMAFGGSEEEMAALQ